MAIRTRPSKGRRSWNLSHLETVAPDVAWSYERDHRGLDEACEKLIRSSSAGDVLEAARVSAALHFHLKIHLAKEDAHLYRILAERLPLPDQMKAMGIMSSHVPQDRFLDLVAQIQADP
jgi:hypothetical protein